MSTTNTHTEQDSELEIIENKHAQPDFNLSNVAATTDEKVIESLLEDIPRWGLSTSDIGQRPLERSDIVYTQSPAGSDIPSSLVPQQESHSLGSFRGEISGAVESIFKVYTPPAPNTSNNKTQHLSADSDDDFNDDDSDGEEDRSISRTHESLSFSVGPLPKPIPGSEIFIVMDDDIPVFYSKSLVEAKLQAVKYLKGLYQIHPSLVYTIEEDPSNINYIHRYRLISNNRFFIIQYDKTEAVVTIRSLAQVEII